MLRDTGAYPSREHTNKRQNNNSSCRGLEQISVEQLKVAFANRLVFEMLPECRDRKMSLDLTGSFPERSLYKISSNVYSRLFN